MNALPSKVTAGEAVACANGHEVGRVARTVTLAHPITAEDVALAADAVTEKAPGRLACGTCGSPVARVLRGARWSVRLDRGWVS